MKGAAAPASEAKIDPSFALAFGKYQLFASLGRGGMADVFLSVARGQMGWSKLAVIKRLRPALAEDPAFRTMFLDEARLAARLSHPNIVHTYEVGEENGIYFIAMEYLEGQSLNKVQKEAARRNLVIEPAVAVRVVSDALAGLGYAHELRDYDGRPLSVIHRDVSPHNIFVTYDGFTKLVDFGIAKAALSSTETEVGVLKGKVAYMSPEQAMGDPIDARSDLFAMGIVLWELLGRRRLMTGESAANTLHKLMNEPIPRLSEVVPDVDPTLEAIVARALEKHPDGRWRTASEMRAALESWLASQSGSRPEDVSRQMLALFGAFREETQRQIQKHMAVTASAENTQELKALNAASLKGFEQGGAVVQNQLLALGAIGREGSGSGIVESYSGLASRPSASSFAFGTQPPPPIAPAPRSNALVVVLALGCVVLAGLLALAMTLRDRRPPALAGASSASRSAEPPARSADAPVASAAPAEPASAAPVVPASALLGVGSATAPATAKAASHARTTPKTAAPPPPPPPAEEPGFVTVSAYPWAKVTEGGRVVCAVTPCSKVPMSPGAHTLMFENGESPGQRQSITVQVRSGETSAKNVGFK
jgi:serine/threonine-protein kinase